MESLFRNALGPLGWVVMLLLPPAIVALYFLKLKRQPLEVPSTYLWLKAIEDLHVNSLWQRMRQSLLLLLQLLLVGLAIAALLRPGWHGESLTGQRFLFLIDNSASMATTDAASRSRLDAAKQRVGDLIDQMSSDMSAMIISFAGQPDVVQDFTNNRRLLREALERIQPKFEPTQIRGALELADGLANPGRVTVGEGGREFDAAAVEPVELYIFSDGLFEPVEGFSLGSLRPKFLPVGDVQTGNLALTALSSVQSESRPELRQAFVQGANFSERPVTATVELYHDGRLLDAAQLQLPADDVAGVTLDLTNVQSGALEARLSAPPDFADLLPVDNRAYGVIDDQRDARVLLATPGNDWVEFALKTARAKRLAQIETVSPDRLRDEALRRKLQTDQYDLVIFDQCAPETSPAANTLYIGSVPPGDAWRRIATGGAPQGPNAEPPAAAGAGESAATPPAPAAPTKIVMPQIIDWQRSHPLLNLIELGNVQLYDSLALTPPEGALTLIDSTKGPLMAIAPRSGYEDAVLGFEIVGRDEQGNVSANTNWPRRPSFPNFFLNVLEYLAGGASDVQQVHRAGEPVEIPFPQPAASVQVRLPDGTVRDAGPIAGGKFVWTETHQLGVYEALVEGQTALRFAVNLLDPKESDVRLRARQDAKGALTTVDSVSIGYVDVEAEPLRSPVRKELWPTLLLIALAVLVLEWYIYNRRVYI